MAPNAPKHPNTLKCFQMFSGHFRSSNANRFATCCSNALAAALSLAAKCSGFRESYLEETYRKMSSGGSFDAGTAELDADEISPGDAGHAATEHEGVALVSQAGIQYGKL